MFNLDQEGTVYSLLFSFGIPCYQLIARVRDNWSVLGYFNMEKTWHFYGKMLVVLN